MNVFKSIGEIIETRDELRELAREMERKSRKLDRAIDELIEFLKHKRLIESRPVRSPEKPASSGT